MFVFSGIYSNTDTSVKVPLSTVYTVYTVYMSTLSTLSTLTAFRVPRPLLPASVPGNPLSDIQCSDCRISSVLFPLAAVVHETGSRA